MAEQTNITKNTRELTKDLYAQANNKDKIAVFQNVNEQIFKRVFVDLLENYKPIYEHFLVEETKFGAGYSLITSGIADMEAFSLDPSKRYPDTRRILQDYKEDITKKIASLVRLTYSRVELSHYFKGLDELEEWIALNRKRVYDTVNLWLDSYIKKIFGATINEAFLKSNEDLYIQAQTLASKFTNVLKYSKEGNAIKNLYRKIMEVLNKMTIEPSDSFHIKKDLVGFPSQSKMDDLILVISDEDYLDFQTELWPNTLNSQFIQLPQNLKVLKLNIPKGTAFILDKRAIQISPVFHTTLEDQYSMTLDLEVINHFHFLTGLFEVYNGVKITKEE
ncbi:P38.8 [Mycoplasma phage P1]|uniref:P38.8 n=1 Tax=Mycoplasma phage P1 TaxID=2905920 RepID=Q9FZQ9_9CAUD|nr:P38.8 [Mycoplasma phage P1]AAG01285.1 P38.8 [Mycoplasma phage P1]